MTFDRAIISVGDKCLSVHSVLGNPAWLYCNNFEDGEPAEAVSALHSRIKLVGRRVLDHGFCRLVDSMGSDASIVQMARVSYGQGLKGDKEDRSLLRYLMRHNHTSPFERVEFVFHMRLPIFVARQMVRHRTASINEISARYTELPGDCFVPDSLRKQSSSNKQGSAGVVTTNAKGDPLKNDWLWEIGDTQDGAHRLYSGLCAIGVARELARVVIPVSTYTEWYFKIDLKNLLHLLNLRCDSHAQEEIRVYADVMRELAAMVVPITMEAWEDYSPYRGGMLLSRMEVEALGKMLDAAKPVPSISESNRENDEFLAKLVRIHNV
jgi:thymidylate synthase (FAD)